MPDAVLLEKASKVSFRVSEEMVTRFAALTGDRSSLHVNETFARRSAYRRPVVHGMLPVAFLPLLPSLRAAGGGGRWVLVDITGRFVAPVYAGDSLALCAQPGSKTETGEMAFEFQIEHQSSGATVTEGSVTLRYDSSPSAVPGPSASTGGEMLIDAMKVSDLMLEQIEKGMEDRVAFRISRRAVSDFAGLLSQGLEEEPGELDGFAERFEIPGLLAVLLFSTSVGVSLPGARATFLEFSARADQPVELDTVYRLEGRVVHRSAATRIVKKELVVRSAGPDDTVVIHGKVAALVNQPSQRMPTMDELDSATDLGLKGKVVLVTGASRGIGETVAKLFAAYGARVVVNYHRGAEDAKRVVKEIGAGGGESIAIAADVSRPDEVHSLVKGAIERFGSIHVLVNNAARDYRPVPFLQLTWDEVQKDLDVIAKGAFLCCQQVLPFMLQQGGGKIINISSVATDNPPADQTKYVMAKSALVGLTRSLSIELASRNIQVNMVVPNFVETDLVAHVQEGFRKKIAQDTPMRRLASPVDVARAVVYLASSLASFTTGQKIMVTGGGAPYL